MPDELRDVVLAIVRDRPLVPVARISTIRNVQMLYGTDGTALAEFCDDQVTALGGSRRRAAVAGMGTRTRRELPTTWTC